MDNVHPDVRNRPLSSSKWAERAAIGAMVIAPGLCFKVSMKSILAFESVALAAIGAQRLYLRTSAGFTRSLEWEADDLYGDFQKTQNALGCLDNASPATYWTMSPKLGLAGVERRVEERLQLQAIRVEAIGQGQNWETDPKAGERIMHLDARYGAALIHMDRLLERERSEALLPRCRMLRCTMAFYLGLYEDPKRIGSLSEALEEMAFYIYAGAEGRRSFPEVKELIWPTEEIR